MCFTILNSLAEARQPAGQVLVKKATLVLAPDSGLLGFTCLFRCQVRHESELERNMVG
jgi:hypothetical protein